MLWATGICSWGRKGDCAPRHDWRRVDGCMHFKAAVAVIRVLQRKENEPTECVALKGTTWVSLLSCAGGAPPSLPPRGARLEGKPRDHIAEAAHRRFLYEKMS